MTDKPTTNGNDANAENTAATPPEGNGGTADRGWTVAPNGTRTDGGEASQKAPLRVSPVDQSVRVPREDDDSRSQRGALPESNWLPTRVSTLVIVALTALTTFAFANTAGLLPVAAVGAGSALALAGALRLITVDRWRVPATLVATVLLVPVGVGLASSLGAGFLLMQNRLFPVPDAQYTRAMLRVVAALAVVAAAALTWFGAATRARDAVERDALRRTLGVSFRTAVPPFVVALLGATLRLAESPLYPPQVGPTGIVGGLVDTVLTLTVAPPALSPHPTTLCLLAVAAAAGVARLIRTLPVAEVAGEDSLAVRAAERLGRGARWGLIAVMLAAVIEFLVPPRVLRELLGIGGYRFLIDLTTATLLRVPLVVTASIATVVVVVVGLIRRTAQAPATETVGRVLPYAVGTGLLVAAASIAGPVVAAIIDAIGAVLISPFDQMFLQLADGVVGFYSPEFVFTALLAGAMLLTLAVVLTLYVADRLGYVRERANGASLAATGLFLAAAFAVPVGAPPGLAFAGIVAAVLAWDAGLHGASLGREVGRRAATTRVELAHVTGTVGVGAVSVLLARALLQTLRSSDVSVPAGVPVASSVVLALGGTFLLVVVLRTTE